MENVSDHLANLAVARQLLLQRVTAGEVRKTDALLAEIADELATQLKESGSFTDFKARRLTQAIKDLQALVVLPAPDLGDLANIEAQWAVSSLATVSITAALPTAATLAAIAASSLVQGATIGAWFADLERGTRFEVERAARAGVSLGETNQQIAKRIIGLDKDGDRGPEALKRARRDAMSITRTAVQTVSNDARMATYEANTDVLRGVQQISTLDGRTTQICIACSGKVWLFPNMRPEGHKIAWNGGPPRHWACRSATLPLTKTFRDLGIDIDELPVSTRASEYGQVAADLSFGDWLKQQGREKMDQLLGPGRADLFQAGKITLPDLINPRTLKPLTLAELRTLHS